MESVSMLYYALASAAVLAVALIWNGQRYFNQRSKLSADQLEAEDQDADIANWW